MPLAKTYTIDYSGTGDTVVAGVTKLDTEIPVIYGHLNTINTNWAAADDVVTAAYIAADVVVAAGQNKVMLVVDQKTAGTDGGTSSTSWAARTLQTEKYNTITGASLAANQVTLPAGTYLIEGSAAAGSSTGAHRLMVYNVTGAATAINGLSGAANGTRAAHIIGTVVLATESVIELRHRCGSSQATTGLGVASDMGEPEIYATLKITKVA